MNKQLLLSEFLTTPWALMPERLQAGSFAWPREDAGALNLTREQFDWLVAGLPWQRLGAPQPQSITVV